MLVQALVLPQPPDLGGGDALVGAVVPLADVVGDLDAGAAGIVMQALGVAVGLPGQVAEAEVEQLQGALGSPAGRDESIGWVGG